MTALILAAGYGTRLYPLTLDAPKPLLNIAGRPLLDFLMDKLSESGVAKTGLITNDKFYRRFLEWADKAGPGIRVVNDKTTSPENRLGAVKDIAFFCRESCPDDDLLVLAGDNLFEDSLDGFLDFARAKGSPAVGAYDVGGIEEAKKFGVLELSSEQKIVGFEEKPANPKSSLAATCIYYIPKAYLPSLEEYLRTSRAVDAAGDYISWLSGKTGVYAYEFTGQWFDIGDKKSLEKAEEFFSKRKEMQ